MLKMFVMFKNIEKIVPTLSSSISIKGYFFQVFCKQQGAAEPEAEAGARPEPLSPAVQRVNVKIIVELECWLELKWHVARSVESQNPEPRKGSQRRENVLEGGKRGS